MSRVKWDQVGERFYETGVDRGVIYQLENGVYTKGEGWNGLSAVNESPEGAEPTPLYANNHKYLELMSAEEFKYTIESYTYPDGFAACNGEQNLVDGVSITQQTRKPFGFTYRSLVGNDEKKNAYGYKIHLVYNSMAAPSEKSHSSVNEDPEVDPMSWECTTTAVDVAGFEPTAHLVIDSTKADPAKLKALEDILYGKDPSTPEGNDGTEPRLPLPDEVMTLMKKAA